MLAVKTIHHPQYERLINQLVSARKAQHLTQMQLAEKLGRPQSYIAKIEGRERKLDIIEFFDLCQKLNENPIDILHAVFDSKTS